MAYRSRYAQAPRPRQSRLRLFMPSILLMLMGAALACFWLYASWRTGQEIDAWLAREAAVGRTWSCPDRRIGGFPFRIEVRCADPTFAGRTPSGPVSGGLKGIVAVAQVHAPHHVIVEAQGPLRIREDDSGRAYTVGWDLLRASVVGKPGTALERLSVQATAPTLTSNAPAGEIGGLAKEIEVHLRRTPDKPAEDGSFDLSATVAGASVPALDALVRGPEATDASALLTITRAAPLGGAGLAVELDRWREAGGRVQVTRASVAKGAKRVDATGTLGIDEFRRPQGRVELTLTGLDDLLQSFGLGNRTAAIGGLIAGVLGGGRAAAPGAPAANGAAAKGIVLPLRLDTGRAFLGPIPVAVLPPLY